MHGYVLTAKNNKWLDFCFIYLYIHIYRYIVCWNSLKPSGTDKWPDHLTCLPVFFRYVKGTADDSTHSPNSLGVQPIDRPTVVSVVAK
jgi:hypothetical protein